MDDPSSILRYGGSAKLIWSRWLWVVLGYVVLTLVFTRPLGWRTGDGYVANLAVDADGSYLFNPYHLKTCLEKGTDCSFTDLQCFPVGNSLALNTNTPIPSLLSLLWRDSTQGLNIVLLLNCFLVAFGGYLYARLFVRSEVLAFIAGALFSFWMGRSAHLWYGHANLMFAAPLPFALYALHRALPQVFAARQPLGIFKPGWGGLFLALGAVTALHDLILAGFILIYVALLASILVYRASVFPLSWYWQVLVLATWVVSVDQLAQWMHLWGFQDNGGGYFSGSLKNFFYPHPVSEFYAATLFREGISVVTRSGFDIGRVMYAGAAFLLLSAGVVLARLVQRERLALPWMLVLLALGILYTMPLIRWANGRWIYGPFYLAHYLPLWNENRCPSRFADVLILLGAVWLMANLETMRWWEKRSPWARQVLGIALLIALLAEHLPRTFFFVDFDRCPSVYFSLQKSKQPSAMFIPFGLVDGKGAFGKLWLEPFAYQPIHQRKMHNGFLSRIDPETYSFFKQDSFMARLVRCEWLEEDLRNPDFMLDTCLYSAPDSAEVLRSLHRLELRQLVFRPGMDTLAVSRYLNIALRPFIVQDTTFSEGHRRVVLEW